MNAIRKTAFIFAAALLLPSAAFGQGAVLQGGPWVNGHIPQYTGAGRQATVLDGGGAIGGAIGVNPGEIGVTARGTGTAPYVAQGTGPYGTNICDYDAPTTNPTGFHFLCFSANAQGGGLLAYGAGGGAAALPLNVSINGVLAPFGAGGGGGVSSITAGTGLGTTPNPITTTGTVYMLATGVASGIYGNATNVPQITVNAQGQITSVANVPISGSGGLGTVTSVTCSTGLTGGTITTTGACAVAYGSTAGTSLQGNGTTLPASYVASSLTSVGTIATGTWAGTTIAVNHGGTGATSFTANAPLIGAGTSPVTVGTVSGNTTTFATASGTLTNGHCVSLDGSGNFIDAGGPCTTGGGGGTVSSSTANQLAYYASNGTTVSGLTTANNGVLITSGAGAPSISTTLPATVQGNITTLGTIGTGVWQGTLVGGQYGGTGVANTGKTITLGASLTTTGTGAPTLAFPATTSYTYTFQGSSDTIVGRATTDTLSSKTFDTASNTFLLNGAAFGTATQATAALNNMVGDSGSGGTKGLVPAPAAGDAAAGKFLKADGTWAPSGGGNSAIYTNAVTTCGADPTGVSDSSSAIQNCISTYGAVAFPTGTYKACNVVISNNQAVVLGTGSLRSSNLASLAAGGGTYQQGAAPGGTVFKCNSTTQSVFVLKNTPAASFTASGSGTTLTVSAVASGFVYVGSTITGTGISGTVLITAQTAGITGSTGTYTTSASTSASGTISSTATTYITATMQGFSCVKDTGVTPTAGACIDNYDTTTRCTQCVFRDLFATNQWNGFNMSPTTYSWFDNITAFSNFNDGFLFASLAAANSNISWSGTGLFASQNNAYGAELANTVGGFLTVGSWTNSGTFANGTGGLYVHASGTSNTINDLYLSNWTSSNDNNDCVKWDTNGGGGLTINGGLIEQCGFGNQGGTGRNLGVAVSNNGNGVDIAGSATFVNILGANIATAASNGVGTASPGPSYLNISNSTFYDNASVASACGGNCNSITIGGSSTIATIEGNTTLNNLGGAGTHQAYGLYTAAANTTVTGNYFQAALSGTCSLTAGVVATGNIGTGCNNATSSGTVTSVTCFGSAITTSGTCTTTGQIPGIASNTAASSGNVGETQTFSLASGSAITLTSGAFPTIASGTLPAGDWDCRGTVYYNASGGATPSNVYGWTSTTSGSTGSSTTGVYYDGTTRPANWIGIIPIGTQQYLLSTGTTVYLGAGVSYGSGTVTGYGSLVCRRMR